MLTKLRAVPRSGIVFAYPFSLRNEVVVCSPLPILISPDGIVAAPGFSAGVTGGDFIAFEKIIRIESELRELVVNERAFVAAASEVQAAELAGFLNTIRGGALKERVSKIEKELARSLDSDRAYSRLEEYAESTSNLSLDSIILLFVIFVISPVLVWKFGLAAVWPFLLAYVVLHAALIAWDFHRANRKLFPTAGISRWSTIAMILLSPPAALRATKYLARDMGLGYHPLAFAASRCSNEQFRELASRVLRGVMFVAETSIGLDKRATDCEQWFRRKFQKAVLALVRKHGNTLEELTASPRRESERVQSYCPRCLSQFVISDGVCTDCDRVSLRAFDL